MAQPLAATDSSGIAEGVHAPSTSLWSPLSHAPLRFFLTSALLANLGALMQGVATMWLLLAMTSSATLIALHQTASAAPEFLLVLVAGALSDIVDRRKLLMFSLGLMALVALALAGIAHAGLAAPIPILLFVFALGVGSTLTMPASAASIPELVPQEKVGAACALLGGAGSVAAALGPPLAGLIITRAGVVAVFTLDAVLLIAALVLITFWRREAPPARLPAEHLIQAMRLGLRYGEYGGAFRGLLVRAAAFALLVSAGMALFPVVARERLAVGASGLGLLFGMFGVGAIAGALAVPKLRKFVSSDVIVAGATILVALGLGAVAVGSSFILVCAGLLAIGLGQSALTTCIVTATQRALPEWVRGRGLSDYLLVFYLGTMVGSAFWGVLATHVGLQLALALAGSGTLATLALTKLFPMGAAERLHSAAVEWPLPFQPRLAPPRPEDGPVLVEITYEVEPGNADAFVEAMRSSGDAHRRAGLMNWGFYRDIENPDHYVEVFMAASWAEHLRQRERPTQDDLMGWESIQPLFHTLSVQHFIVPSAWHHVGIFRHQHDKLA